MLSAAIGFASGFLMVFLLGVAQVAFIRREAEAEWKRWQDGMTPDEREYWVLMHDPRYNPQLGRIVDPVRDAMEGARNG